ncbi:MAG TPA: hypothetical protein VFO21_00470 [Vicinamibacterales bacterium]|nr:hypothetical protein [Vicinamibacterales bacterium]
MILFMLALVAVSCGGDTNPIGPANQPEVANLQDNFQFQASNLTGTTQTLTYTWPNSGTSANVNQSGTVSSGTATLIVRTPSGQEAYSRDLSQTGTFTTASGSAGNWQIEVRLVNVTGTLNFRVQKP